ncbi:MAG: alanine--glyoxylate aminotransferase family protein [Candidatus Bathyarchaeota archaeon]|nr:alanine--glyoxylate aminotransferase family protein [Candidatus Bathyarchaeota archaeon]MDH5532264.1 alanine--glyoxylate aminotransferase family protein [Candidatus Bathyarchaeota archaeon]
METKKSLIMLPGPTNLSDRVMQAMTKPIISHREPEFHALHQSILNNLRYVFQTKNDVFVLTSSGTGGVYCAISNIVNPNDKVIIPVFGVFSQRMKEKIVRCGGKPVELPLKWGEAPTAEQIEHIVEKEGDVKAIALMYNETSTGVTVRDLPKIGRIARENNLILVVDAISVLGGDRLPVDEWGIDVCVVGSQKCLACPPGLAMVSVSDRAWEVIEKTAARPYYFDLVKMKEFSAKNETPYTPAVPLFYALDEALKMIREEGLEKRFKRHSTCARAFYKAVEALKLKPFPNEKVRSNTVIAVNMPAGVNNTELRKIMREQHKVSVAGGQSKLKESIIRIGCLGIISEKETIPTIEALEDALSALQYPVQVGTGVEAARRVFHS